MKSFIQKGDMLTAVAPYAVASGMPFKVGALVLIAVTPAAAQGVAIEGMTKGVYSLPKASAQAWAVGDRVYWDDTAKLMTAVATDNTLVGCAVEAAGNPSTMGKVYLDGAIRLPTG